ncbi:PIG-L family deacetylase [Bordetella sp. 2513F-2]
MTQAEPWVIISPHFDDAVLSCGALLSSHPGSTVLTVFSGVPHPGTPLPDWDRRCGFERADQAMLAREREDTLALALLGAKALRLGLLDQQYADPDGPDRLPGMLAGALDLLQPQRVLTPLGLFHQDHARVSDAVATIGPLLECEWYAYEEALYRCKPGLVQRRLAELRRRGVRATPADLGQPETPPPIKARAVAAYASQLRALGLAPGEGDPARAERYWRLEWVSCLQEVA